jgi:hypothetical protein
VHRFDHGFVLVRAGDGEHGGNFARIASASLPMQPVTMTRPFSAIASPIAARLSSLAESRKPQVLTSTTSAPA